jgi:pilus assembly protein CpaB
MGALRIAILAVAAIAAIAVALLVRGMMGPRQAAEPAVAEAATPMARVLVAQRDLAVGTMLAAADMGWQPWPVDAVNDTMITDGAPPAPPAKGAAKVAEAAGALVAGPGKIEALEGAVVKDAILKGEPIVSRKIVRGGEGGFMSVLLQPGMQAIGVPISNETTAGGFILPGDRVDVLQGRDAGGDRGYVTETLLRNVRVLAIDQATEPGKDAKTIVGSVATLEVPTRDVPVIVRAKAQGQMVLALRAYSDIGGAVGRGGLGENTTVRIFRAGEATEVAVR